MRSSNAAAVIRICARASTTSLSRRESQIVQGVHAAAHPVGRVRRWRTAIQLEPADRRGVIAPLHLALQERVVLWRRVVGMLGVIAVLIRRAVSRRRAGRLVRRSRAYRGNSCRDENCAREHIAHHFTRVPPAGFEPATPALGEPPSPPGRGSERYSELTIKRHSAPTETTACRGFTDQAPTTASTRFRAQKRAKPPATGGFITEAGVKTTFGARVSILSPSLEAASEL